MTGIRILLFFLALSCVHPGSASDHGKEEHSKAEAGSGTAEFQGPVFEIRDTPPDFKMPTILWDKIMAGEPKPAGKDGGHDSKAAPGEEKEKKDDLLIVWLPIEVTFSAKQSGILVHKSVQYKLPRGGGALDLSKITAGDRGTFFLNFNLSEFSNRPAVKVFFISNAKKRKVDGEVFGAGCNVYFDVTDAVQKSLGSNGLRFNITDNRHISALSGHFVFVQADKDKVYLAQVEIGDFQNREYLCKI